MATTKAPLFGLDASGALGGSIVFSKWRGRTYVRKLSIPHNPKSKLQIGMRSVFKFITQDFKNLTQAQKDAWDSLAAPDNITQLNAQVRDAQRRARVNQGFRRGPAESLTAAGDAPTNLATVDRNKSLVLSWTAGSPVVGEYVYVIYMDLTTGPTGTIDNIVGVVPIATTEITITGLVNELEHFWVVRPINFDGLLGTPSTEDSGTPSAT